MLGFREVLKIPGTKADHSVLNKLYMLAALAGNSIDQSEAARK